MVVAATFDSVATYAHGDMWDVEHQHRAYDVWRSRHLY
jgi:hypothetical protein